MSFPTSSSTGRLVLDVLHGPIVVVPSSQEAEEGESVQVVCNITANPAPTSVEWFKEGDRTFQQQGHILR